MPKLKSLRASIGAYGRVAAGGIIEVDEKDVKKLIDTKRFVLATEKDIAKAQRAQSKHMKVAVTGAGAAFAPMPETPQPIEDEFSAMEIDQQRKAIEDGFLALRLEEARIEGLTVDMAKREEDLSVRRTALNDDLKALAKHADDNSREVERLKGEAERLDALAKELDKRQGDLAAAEADAAAKAEAAKAKKSADKGAGQA